MRRIVVAGNGMVGHRFVEAVSGRGFEVGVIGEEPRPAYDRVNLSSYFDGKSAADLALADAAEYARAGVDAWFGERVVSVDRGAKRVTTSAGRVVDYDLLVLATGSAPFVPPVGGR